jgi:thioredoxin reductase
MFMKNRRTFLKTAGFYFTTLSSAWTFSGFTNHKFMNKQQTYEVIITGGSHAGLAAGMSLGRGLKNVLIIDSGNPCNKQTPHSHNFLTHDGRKPAELLQIARAQVLQYPTVHFQNGTVTAASGTNNQFEISTDDGQHFKAKKLLFATGVKDIMPGIEGFAPCWGISVIHCPYCHGYEYKDKPTGILMNGEGAVDYSIFISNWTDKLTLYTNGKAVLSPEQSGQLARHRIRIVEKEITRIAHSNGYLSHLIFTDGSREALQALYARPAFEQHCKLPAQLGCALTEGGYIQVDELKKTSIAGIYAAGDNSTMMRSVATAIAAGTMAGAMLTHELIRESA